MNLNKIIQFFKRMAGINVISAQEIVDNARAQAKQPIKESLPYDDTIAYVSFLLNEEGNINIVCAWDKQTPTIAKYYGELLFHISNGTLRQNIIDVLHHTMVKQPESTKFVKSAVKAWDKIEEKYNSSPIVSPMGVFAVSNTKKGSNNEIG
jgi:hypothetical protein